MRFHVLPMVGLAVMVLGCAGGQTGDLSGNSNDGGETASNGCIERRQKLASLDEVTDYGSGEQLLAYAEGSFEAPLSWKEPEAGASWSVGPESGTSAIQLEVTRGQSAYLLTYEAEKPQGGIEIGRICPEPQLGVEAHVTVTTEGGALAESFDTLLRGTGGGLATLSVPLSLSKLDGTLEVSTSNPDAKLVQVTLDATLTAAGSTGSISGVEQVNHGAVSSAGRALLAVWPDAPACSGDAFYGATGLSVAADDDALGITGEAAAELLSSMTPVDVQWLDGEATELTLTTTLLGEGCLRATHSAIPGDPSGTTTYPARFELRSADGRLEGEYTGTLVSYPDGAQHGVTAQAQLTLTPAEVEGSGFAGASVPSGVERLAVVFEARREGVIASGSVRLSGLTDPQCVTEPQNLPGMGSGVPGCPGVTVTPIEAASWGEP